MQVKVVPICMLVAFGGIVLWNYQSSDAEANAAPSEHQTIQVPERIRPAGIGETVLVRELNGNRWWPCASSKAAFEEIDKWVALRDMHEVVRTVLKTRSIGITAGMDVKILRGKWPHKDGARQNGLRVLRDVPGAGW